MAWFESDRTSHRAYAADSGTLRDAPFPRGSSTCSEFVLRRVRAYLLLHSVGVQRGSTPIADVDGWFFERSAHGLHPQAGRSVVTGGIRMRRFRRNAPRRPSLRGPSPEQAVLHAYCAPLTSTRLRFSMSSSTTSGSASVLVSPRSSNSCEATLRMIRRMILPERVFGSAAVN